MKKLFIMLLALTAVGVPAFAAPAGLSEKVARTAQSSRDAIEAKKNEVLSDLKAFRSVTQGRREFNGSYVLQDMLNLMDDYLALADVSESAAISLNNEINRPIQSGWGATVTVAQLIRDNCQYVRAGTSTADDFDRFEELLGRKSMAKPSVAVQVEKTVAAAPGYLREGVRTEAEKTFRTYFTANPSGEVQEAAYAPLAALLTNAIGLNQMIARTQDIDQKESFAAQWFFSQDIPGAYAALKAVNPQLAAATNELMRSFMYRVSNGMPGHMPAKDVQDYNNFAREIDFHY